MTNLKHMYDEYFHHLKPALQSKAEEFLLLGYDKVNEEDIWKFLQSKTWKNPEEGRRTYQLVADILSLDVGSFMNYASVEAFRSPSPLEAMNDDELQQWLNTEDT